MRKYRVAQGCTILVDGSRFKGGFLRGGQIITDNDNIPNIKDHVKNGFLIPVNLTDHAEETVKRSPESPGVDEQVVLRGDKEEEDVKATPLNIQTSKSKKSKVNKADLVDKSLEELNELVLSLDDSVDPFEDENEAIAWLAQHGGK